MNSNSFRMTWGHHLLQELFICYINLGIMERTYFPTPYIHTADFGHIYTLVLALFSVLLQKLDLDLLLAPCKSIFYSAIVVEILVTGLLKPSLGGNVF